MSAIRARHLVACRRHRCGNWRIRVFHLHTYRKSQVAGNSSSKETAPNQLRRLSRVHLAVSRRIFRITSVERNSKKMKTFIVYDLDSQMPIAVGEQVSAESARYCASVTTGSLEANLLAEEIDLEKQITY